MKEYLEEIILSIHECGYHEMDEDSLRSKLNDVAESLESLVSTL